MISDGEHAMMHTLHKNNIECPLPVLNIYGAEKSLEKLNDGTSTVHFTANFFTTWHTDTSAVYATHTGT